MEAYTMRSKPRSEWTADASKYPQGYFKQKECGKCADTFTPRAPSHLYCSQSCSDSALMDRYLLRTYGMLRADYEELLSKQGNKCGICHGAGFVMAAHHSMLLVVDHCHRSGEVRGLLCHNCNRALGLLHDNKDSLLRAVDYLKAQRPSLRGVRPSGRKRTALHSR